MSKEQQNKAIVERWFKEFWGNPWNPAVVDELGAPDVLVHYRCMDRERAARPSRR